MQKKRIDENTIQVIIDQDDLDERGITMLDLLGNQKQIEDFFYSVLDEVDTEHQFRKNDSVTFQALPIKDGLELIISKNIKKKNTSNVNQISKLIADQLRGHDSKGYSSESRNDHETANSDHELVSNTFVVRFENFEDFISLAQTLDTDDLTSDLYLYENHYYLVIKDLDQLVDLKDQILDYKAIASEFGTISSQQPCWFEEHGKKIMSQSALDTARYYFK